MLTINNILKLYQEGIDIIVTNKLSDIAGEWDISNLCIWLYKRNIKSEKERDLTLIHELIHAKEDLIDYKGLDEAQVEEEAVQTYLKKPYIIEFLKEMEKNLDF